MAGYLGNIPVPQATQTREVFTATASQTTFATAGYPVGFVDVWLNGVKLINGTDFTATNGSDVVLTTGAAAGDTVEVISNSTFEVNSQTFTGTTKFADGSASAPSITNTGDENTGVFFPAADTVGLATGGSERLRIDSSGTVIFNNAIQETTYSLTGTALDPSNGTVQYKTLSANTTLTDSIAAGESMTLMIDDGSAYTITWPTMTWVNNGGTAPTLATTGYTVVALWKVSTTLYGALVGDGS